LPATKHLHVVKTSDVDKVEELDSSYPDTYLECRSVGHRWKVIGFYHQGGEIVRALLCDRCDMDRHDYWSRQGARLRNSYIQPGGYGITNGGVSKHEVRQEVLNRVDVYDSAEAMNAAILGTKKRKSS
jgi:hypothetical protein